MILEFKTRYDQTWVSKVVTTPKEAFNIAKKYQDDKLSIANCISWEYVDLLEYAHQNHIHIDLLK